jgi:blue light- and temperature-responsive anti-repressor
MDSDLQVVVYCSTSEIKGSDAEVAAELHKILFDARSKNSGLGITGALLYNHGDFAQILEGPRNLVAQLIGTIRVDPRHLNVTVCLDSPSTERAFPDWSMAFGSSGEHADIDRAIGSVFAGSPHAGEEMRGLLQGLIVKEDDWLL